MYGQPVLRLVRPALLVVLAFLVLGLVVAVGSSETGPIEKSVLALAIVGLLAAGVPVRRIGFAGVALHRSADRSALASSLALAGR